MVEEERKTPKFIVKNSEGRLTENNVHKYINTGINSHFPSNFLQVCYSILYFRRKIRIEEGYSSQKFKIWLKLKNKYKVSE